MENWDIAAVRIYVGQCFERDTTEHFCFHNLSHTEHVVHRVKEIGSYYHLPEKDFFILESAAWFHDLGYLYTDIALHESKSVSLMENFMKGSYPDLIIEQIKKVILATKESVRPETMFEKIIRDADTYHFGTVEFWITDQLVQTEMERIFNRKFPQWKAQTLSLLRKHTFYTSYCQDKLNTGKQENIAQLERIVAGSWKKP